MFQNIFFIKNIFHLFQFLQRVIDANFVSKKDTCSKKWNIYTRTCEELHQLANEEELKFILCKSLLQNHANENKTYSSVEKANITKSHLQVVFVETVSFLGDCEKIVKEFCSSKIKAVIFVADRSVCSTNQINDINPFN